jgi:hypothetical protein
MSASRAEQQFTEQQLTERQVTQFAELGVQYYVAARSAAWAGLLPVCGNLYHHALEMLLKAALSRNHSLEKLKRTFSHNLIELWKSFKVSFPSTELSQFDATIAEIKDFEEIRYPDEVKSGVTIRLEWVANPAEMVASSPPMFAAYLTHRDQPYVLYPPAVDRLVLEIFRASSLSPKAFTMALKPDVLKTLADSNPVAAELLP